LKNRSKQRRKTFATDVVRIRFDGARVALLYPTQTALNANSKAAKRNTLDGLAGLVPNGGGPVRDVYQTTGATRTEQSVMSALVTVTCERMIAASPVTGEADWRS
jgi:hypothetical protein